MSGSPLIPGGQIVLPEGWSVGSRIEGGQPNGVGTLEPSNFRDWFTDLTETHHRTVITVYGPWEEGPTERAAREQECWAREHAAEQDEEERILREADAIRARRAAEENAHGA